MSDPVTPPPVPVANSFIAPPMMSYAGPPNALDTVNALRYPPGIVEAQGLVARDVSCRKCAYNLRGIPVEGRCPECGRAVGLSILGDLLRFSDPAWLKTLHRGINLILISVLASVLIAFAAFFLRTSTSNASIGAAGSPAAFMGLIAQALSFAGAWFLTAPDPSGIGEDIYGTSRGVIRVTLLIGLLQPVLTMAMALMQPPAGAIQLLGVANILIGIAALVGEFARFQYLGKLAGRIPDGALADRANFLKWALAICYGVLLLAGAVMVLVGFAGGAAAGLVPIGCLAGLAGIALLVFEIMNLFMLGRFGRAFKAQEQIARAAWSSTGPV